MHETHEFPTLRDAVQFLIDESVQRQGQIAAHRAVVAGLLEAIDLFGTSQLREAADIVVNATLGHYEVQEASDSHPITAATLAELREILEAKENLRGRKPFRPVVIDGGAPRRDQ